MKLFLNTNLTPTKKVFTTAIFVLMLTNMNGQSDNPIYDKHLADSLGADDYGMKMYVLVILKPGRNKINEKKRADSLLSGHLQNINHLAETGKLVAAGPIKRNEKEYEGIWLGVWEKNFRAQKFYAKYGFEKFGSHTFQMGDDPQVDWLLKKKL